MLGNCGVGIAVVQEAVLGWYRLCCYEDSDDACGAALVPVLLLW